MTGDKVAEARNLAQSILAGVQSLEDLEPHEGWAPEDIDRYLDETVKAIKAADTSIFGLLYDLAESPVI